MQIEHKIIGSRLFVELFPQFSHRLKEPADTDVLVNCDPDEQTIAHFKWLYGNKTEVHYCPILWNALSDGYLDRRNVYFTVKCSHCAFDTIHQNKTFYDIWLMCTAGCVLIEPLFWELYSYWKNKFPPKWRADFTKESSDFFNDAVSREHIHDELHEFVKKYEKPAFKFLQEDDQTTVWVCPEKFKYLSDDLKRQVIIEESQVLAIERELLNPRGIKNQYVAYLKWLKAMVDRIAPEWQIPYILQHYNYFVSQKQQYYEQTEAR